MRLIRARFSMRSFNAHALLVDRQANVARPSGKRNCFDFNKELSSIKRSIDVPAILAGESVGFLPKKHP